MRGMAHDPRAIKFIQFLCAAQITVLLVFASPAPLVAVPYADRQSNVQGGFPLYDWAGINDPDCIPHVTYTSVTVDPWPDYCMPGAKSEVTDTTDFFERRRVSPDKATPIRTRLSVVPEGDYLVYVSGTVGYTATYFDAISGWIQVTGTADAECTTKGAGPYSNNPPTETATTDLLWIPHRFDQVDQGRSADRLDLRMSFGDGSNSGEGKNALDGNPNPSPLEGIDDWIPTNTSVSVSGEQFFEGCSPTHEYYAFVDSDALNFPMDLMLFFDGSFGHQALVVTAKGQDADLNFILRQGEDPSCLPANTSAGCDPGAFSAPRKLWAANSTAATGDSYTYMAYPCPKWPGEDWIRNGTPPGTTRTLNGDAGAITSATMLVDTRRNYDEGLVGNANTGVYGSQFNTYGATVTVSGVPQFVTSTRADGTRFAHFEQSGARGGAFTCNWAFPGFKYRLEASGSYFYNSGMPAWRNCNYPKAAGSGKKYCIEQDLSTSTVKWVLDPVGVTSTLAHSDGTLGFGCRKDWAPMADPVDVQDPDAVFSADPLDPDNTIIAIPGNSTNTAFNSYLGAGFHERRNGYEFDSPNWFNETCTNGYVWQCQTPEARENEEDDEEEYPYSSHQCFLREPDGKGDASGVTHRGGTLVGPSARTVVPVATEVINGITQTVVSTTSSTTATVVTAKADAECATSPWAMTEKNNNRFLPGTKDPMPAYDPPITQTSHVSGHPIPTDPNWRFDRARGGGLRAGDAELGHEGDDDESYGAFRPKTFPPITHDPPTSTSGGGVGWYMAEYDRLTGLPTWVQFTGEYHDWYDLYVDSEPLRSWGMPGYSDQWHQVQRHWRPVSGTARTLNPDHLEYSCSDKNQYFFDDFSPAGAGPVQFTISDYDMDSFNLGHLKVTMTKLGPRTDIPRYRDWCQVTETVSADVITSWTLGVPETLPDGSLSKNCDVKKFLEIEWVKADTTNASSAVDTEEAVFIRNTAEVTVTLNGMKLETGRGAVTLTTSDSLAIAPRGQAKVRTYLGVTESGQTATVTATMRWFPAGAWDPTTTVTTFETTEVEMSASLAGFGLMYGAGMEGYVGDTMRLLRPQGTGFVEVSRFEY